MNDGLLIIWIGLGVVYVTLSVALIVALRKPDDDPDNEDLTW